MITMMIISNTLIILYDPAMLLNRTYAQFYKEFMENLAMPNVHTIHVFIHVPDTEVVRPVYCSPYNDTKDFIRTISTMVDNYSKRYVERDIPLIFHLPKIAKHTPVLCDIQIVMHEEKVTFKYFCEDYTIFKMAPDSYMLIGFFKTIFGERIILQKLSKPELSVVANTSIVVPYYGIFHGDLDMAEEVGDDYDLFFTLYTKQKTS